MGDPFVGIVHPCKVYNILGVGAPLLYIGAKESPVADIATQIEDQHTVYRSCHGEPQRIANHIVSAAALGLSQPRNGAEMASRFSEAQLLPRMIEILETQRSEVICQE
jgi:hypothetical protein